MHNLNLLDRGDFARALMNMRDDIDKMLAIILPDEAAIVEAQRCKHPADKIQEDGAMGEDTTYHCTACNATQDTPFHTEV